ncbi:MAG: putative rane protein [Eubacterium sp.]|jgi:heptaprenyl diphosphate synthase|nr:putative rane protein [Eubacterium sp.]
MRIFLRRSPDIKKIVYLSLLAAQAIVLSIIESQFPVSIGVPGIKLGLANIVTMVTLVFFSYSDTLLIVLIRCVIASLFMGGPVLFMFSLLGGLLSATIMWIMLKSMKKLFSLVGMSIAGSIAHNVGQIMVACFIMGDLSVTAYLPVLLVSGILMGCFVGICSTFMVKALKKLNLIENI